MRQELSRLPAKVCAGPPGPEPKHPPYLRAIPSERRVFRLALRAPASKAVARSAGGHLRKRFGRALATGPLGRGFCCASRRGPGRDLRDELRGGADTPKVTPQPETARSPETKLRIGVGICISTGAMSRGWQTENV